ncbi:TorF family putative porin [Ectothiorhodospira marina]|uniref:Uncharacterized protein n=1 Tax=Ectothiorhodospira marina TaxID=1396821 RepID=A0A1H7K6S0_9GAMM|nr:TorF family putative porin [Ectothiorhodospira marina]SEK82206.1 conserved hypothetical protein [Ectothiorhodospira marina]
MSKALTQTALTAAVTTALLAGAAITSTASAEVSANIGFTSNYMFRGITQTDDQAAVQGGLDYEHEGGFYAGTWASNVDFGGGDTGYEIDGYFGVAGGIGDSGVGFDVGYIYYAYPTLDDADLGELYGALDFMGFYGMVNFVTNADTSELEDTLSYELGYAFDIMSDTSLGATVGYVDPDEGDGDYTWWSLYATKVTDLGDFTFAYTQNDIDAPQGSNIDDPRVNVSYVMSF